MAYNSTQTSIQQWRSNTESGQQASPIEGLLSKLSIDGKLYSIKDPAVEQLAGLVDSQIASIDARIEGLEGHQFTAVTKDNNAGKFATGVTQGTDGSISVTYENIRSEALTKGTTDGDFVTTLTQGIDGQITATYGNVTADRVNLNPNLTPAGWSGITTVQGALTKIVGASTDATTDVTIEGAKKYAESLVNNLAGEDWSQNAKKVQQIIAELEGSDSTEAWTTLADKLKGLTIDDGQGGTSDATVAEYIEAKVAEINEANSEGIASLNATVFSTGSNESEFNAATTNVKVSVTEAAGKLTSVTVVTNDIASASTLTALSGEVIKSINGATPTNNNIVLDGSKLAVSATNASTIAESIEATNTKLASKIEVNNWTATYVTNEEKLAWTNQPVEVYGNVKGS